MTDLGTLGGTLGLATLLNNRGDVVGTSNLAGDQTSHPFLWRDGKLVDLFTSTIGGNPTTANQLSESGEIVGGAAFPNRPFDAYLWRNGVAIDLGTLTGDCFSEAVALNSIGQVVGYSQACDLGSARSFLWENGSMVNLNALVRPNADLQLVETIAINDQGEIAGDGDPGCRNDVLCGHAYVLIPCDESHPGVEGCDYSLVDATATAPSAEPRYVPSGTPHMPQSRPTNRSHFPGLTISPTN
jgi:probable HAF family extracellular repeat protein